MHCLINRLMQSRIVFPFLINSDVNGCSLMVKNGLHCFENHLHLAWNH
jgi:hypothetical protein